MTENDWFEAAWEQREEDVYPRLFGDSSRGIFALDSKIFLETFRQETFDPRWLHYGVFEFAPTSGRSSWLYVSSGLSNAWEDDEPHPDGESGLGMEFILEAPSQEVWPVLRLQHVVAFQILIAHGRFERSRVLDLHDRIPLRASITPEESSLTWLLVGPPDGHAPSFTLATGRVDLLSVVGITEGEAAYGRESGGDALLSVLREKAAYPLTNPERSGVVAAA